MRPQALDEATASETDGDWRFTGKPLVTSRPTNLIRPTTTLRNNYRAAVKNLSEIIKFHQVSTIATMTARTYYPAQPS